MRGATIKKRLGNLLAVFQSTRPVRGATALEAFMGHSIKISIHAPRAGRDPTLYHMVKLLQISIHAPRAGRDEVTPDESQVPLISIHAPRAGRDAFTSMA